MIHLSASTVRRLLDERKWQLCADLAADLLPGSEISQQDKAFVSFALARSLSFLDRYTAALEPGQIAVFLANELGDFDLLGMALWELAGIQRRIPGQEYNSMENYRRFIENKDRYSNDLRRERLHLALYNLAVVERSCNLHQEALEHFGQARAQAWAVQDYAQAERCRQDQCWQALSVNNLELAEQLIAKGERYTKDHPQDILAQIHQLNDMAQYAYLKKDYGNTIGHAMELIFLAEKHDQIGLLANGLLIWSKALERLEDLDSALRVGMWAHIEAQRADRPELVAEIREYLEGIRLQDRAVVDRVMADVVRPASKKEGST